MSDVPAMPREAFVSAFIAKLGEELDFFCARHDVVIERFDTDGDEVVHARVLGVFRSRKFSFRQQIWPAYHPPMLAGDLCATHLEERLLSRAWGNSEPASITEV